MAAEVSHYAVEIHKSDEGHFVEVPFEVPENIGEIRIQIKVQPHAKKPCIIDVGLTDPAQVRGWSGSTKYDLRIALDSATPGYLAGDIPPGRWAVILGVYTISEAGAHVEADITLVPHQDAWVKGDLHLHTVHSDGAYTFAELDEIAKARKFDYVGLTDHNTVSQNFSYPQESPVTYIPAMELTTYHGHANLFGVPIPCDDFRVQDVSDVERLLKEAKSRGAFIAINHPFDDTGPSCQWQWGYDVPFDWLEVWNGPWRACNAASLALWQDMLAAGKRIVAVGGSDTHREHPYVRHGVPTTWVKSSSRTVDAILHAINQGHAFISFSPEGPTLELTCGDHMMGDLVPNRQQSEIALTVAHVQPGDIIKLISEQGVAETYTVQPGEQAWQKQWSANGKRFWRVEIWRHFAEVNDMLLVGMSNPIYFAK